MRLWLAVLAVTVGNWVLKASGPLAMGDRRLPDLASRITGLTAPVLLAGLIVTELGSRGWGDVDWTQVAGVGTAGLTRLARTPMLLAVVLGIGATALLRWQ